MLDVLNCHLSFFWGVFFPTTTVIPPKNLSWKHWHTFLRMKHVQSSSTGFLPIGGNLANRQLTNIHTPICAVMKSIFRNLPKCLSWNWCKVGQCLPNYSTLSPPSWWNICFPKETGLIAIRPLENDLNSILKKSLGTIFPLPHATWFHVQGIWIIVMYILSSHTYIEVTFGSSSTRRVPWNPQLGVYPTSQSVSANRFSHSHPRLPTFCWNGNGWEITGP